MIKEKHTCEGRIWYQHDYYPCGKTASNYEQGQWFCRRHTPSLMEAKKEARYEKAEAEWAIKKHQLLFNHRMMLFARICINRYMLAKSEHLALIPEAEAGAIVREFGDLLGNGEDE